MVKSSRSAKTKQMVRIRLRRWWSLTDPTRPRRIIIRAIAVATAIMAVWAGVPVGAAAVVAFTLVLRSLPNELMSPAWRPRHGTLAAWAPHISAGWRAVLARDASYGLGMTEHDANPLLWCAPGPPTGAWRHFGRLNGHMALIVGLATAVTPQPGGVVSHLVSGAALYYLAQSWFVYKSAGAPFGREPVFNPALATYQGQGGTPRTDTDGRDVTTIARSAATIGTLVTFIGVLASIVLWHAAAPATLASAIVLTILVGAFTGLRSFRDGYAGIDLIWAHYVTARATQLSGDPTTGAGSIFARPMLPANVALPQLVSLEVFPSTDEPIYEVATFQAPPTFGVAELRHLEGALATAIGARLALNVILSVDSAYQRDSRGRPQGPALNGMFTLTYNASERGPRPHLTRWSSALPVGLSPRPGDDVNTLTAKKEALRIARDAANVDEATGRFFYRTAVRQAFDAAGIRGCEVTGITHLHLPPVSETNTLLVEASVTLPAGTTRDAVMKVEARITAGLGAPFCRVGWRVDEAAEREYVAEEMSVVFGTNPADLVRSDGRSALRPDVARFIAQLDWTARFRVCKVVTADGRTPRLIETSRNADGLVECDFALPPGLSLDAVDAATIKLRSLTRADLLSVTAARLHDDDDLPIPGTELAGLCSIRYLPATDADDPETGAEPLRRRDVEPVTAAFLTEVVVGRAFVAAKLAEATLMGVDDLYHDDATGAYLAESRWTLPAGVTYETFISRSVDAVTAALGVPFVRIGRRVLPSSDGHDEPAAAVSVIYGDHPEDLALDPSVTLFLEGLLWDRYFRSCKLTSAAGLTPRLITHGTHESGLDLLTFATVEGLAVERIVKANGELTTAVKLAYVAVEDNEDGRTFRILLGESDPLDRLYLYTDYHDRIIPEPHPVPGVLDLTWAVGVGIDQQPIYDSFLGDLPMLLIAGGSGMGKSASIGSMIVQLCAKNEAGTALEVILGDPKNELIRFKSLPHVTRFVDMQTPGESHYQVFADLLAELDVEMERRYEYFNTLPGMPQKLSEARAVLPEGVKLPAILCVLEEVADILAAPPSGARAERGDWERCVVLVARLCRKARAAGIFLVLATQRPTKEAVGSAAITGQCRRVGLGCDGLMASLIIIGQPGLEDISTPGRGKVTSGKAYRDFRGFYFRGPDDEGMHGVGDLQAAVNELSIKVEGAPPRVFTTAGHAGHLTPPTIPDGIWVKCHRDHRGALQDASPSPSPEPTTSAHPAHRGRLRQGH